MERARAERQVKALNCAHCNQELTDAANPTCKTCLGQVCAVCNESQTCSVHYLTRTKLRSTPWTCVDCEKQERGVDWYVCTKCGGRTGALCGDCARKRVGRWGLICPGRTAIDIRKRKSTSVEPTAARQPRRKRQRSEPWTLTLYRRVPDHGVSTEDWTKEAECCDKPLDEKDELPLFLPCRAATKEKERKKEDAAGGGDKGPEALFWNPPIPPTPLARSHPERYAAMLRNWILSFELGAEEAKGRQTTKCISVLQGCGSGGRTAVVITSKGGYIHDTVIRNANYVFHEVDSTPPPKINYGGVEWDLVHPSAIEETLGDEVPIVIVPETAADHIRDDHRWVRGTFDDEYQHAEIRALRTSQLPWLRLILGCAPFGPLRAQVALRALALTQGCCAKCHNKLRRIHWPEGETSPTALSRVEKLARRQPCFTWWRYGMRTAPVWRWTEVQGKETRLLELKPDGLCVRRRFPIQQDSVEDHAKRSGEKSRQADVMTYGTAYGTMKRGKKPEDTFWQAILGQKEASDESEVLIPHDGKGSGAARKVTIHGEKYEIRGSTGQNNLCLFDSLRQLLTLDEDAGALRTRLIANYREHDNAARANALHDEAMARLEDVPALSVMLSARIHVHHLWQDGTTTEELDTGGDGTEVHVIHQGVHFEPLHPMPDEEEDEEEGS